ncbi:unnamed protein product [Clonostachys rosea f. rosea IK726]|uniref:Major facilitator superfamily (MFS) profile domain-containing protein n=2 Tax=Bionectria ochroleuca TaxID=29856 RepID=A0A0B7K2B0_BIOOC|nr:unnamed protein product [Clonostachys rosea f. rosea IK726]
MVLSKTEGVSFSDETENAKSPGALEDVVHLEGKMSREDIQKGMDHSRVDPEVAKYASERAVEISEAEDKRLRRLINKRVLSVMIGTYFLQALDKETISFVAIMGIRDDLHLVGQQYSWLTTCIYLAIVVVEFPTNWIIQRAPIAKYLSANIILWGITLALHAICKDFAGIPIARTVLGALEACCQPVFIVMSATWFKREEQAAVTILWLVMAGLQQIVGGLLGYGFSNIPTWSPIKSWQALYTAYGSLTVLWGVFVLYWMPDSQTKAKCFSEEDKALMIERVRKNQTGVQNRIFRREQVWEAFKDPQTYAFCILQICTTIPSGGLSAFSAILINSFGFSLIQTQLLAMGPGAVQIIVMISSIYLERKFKQVTLIMIGGTLPAIAGTVVFLTVPWSTDTRIGLLIAYYCIWSFYVAVGLLLSLISRNIAGQTKKATVIATTFVFWAAGNSAGPQVFRATDAPRYFTAFAVQMACWIVLVITLLALRTYYVFENKKMDQKIADGRAVADDDLVHSFEDITDKENVNFRYIY